MKAKTMIASSMLVLSCVSSPPLAAGREVLTVSDVIEMESASQFEYSPDGRFLVWVKYSPDRAKNRKIGHLMLTTIADTTTIQLTRGGDDSSPHFSPSGSQIAFLRRGKKGKSQIFLLRLPGGEPEKITSLPQGVKDLAWRNSSELIFSAREDSTLRERRLKKAKDDAIVVADQEHYPPVRLFSLELPGKKVKRLATNQGQITKFSVSWDGRYVVTSENQDVNYEYDYKIPPKQFLMDLETNERREIFTAPYVDPYDFKWTRDSQGFYCRRAYASDSADTYVSIDLLYYYHLASDRLVRVPLGWRRGLGHSYRITKGGAVVALADGTRDRIVYLRRDGFHFRIDPLSGPEEMPMALYAADPQGERIVYARSDASTVPTIMTATIAEGKLVGEMEVVKLNEKLRKKKLARHEVITWRGSKGDAVEGILYYPLDYADGERYPLVALIHGGPAGVDRDYFSERWSNYPHLLASRGTFVLKVNYHGSGNYGLKWVESIKGHYYEYEVPDILKGIDHLIRKGLVDKNRLGIMGWSNGSILAIECALRSGRFRVLCAGAGDVNWTSDYGNCAFGAAFDNAYLGGPPWRKLSTYIKKSPVFRMHKMKTPTLIMFGTEDTSVPTEQGWQHFRAMQQEGKAPVRFILFPGASHGLRKLSHQKRKVEEELDWFDRYLFEKEAPENEAFDENSPLALALAKTEVAGAGRLYGVYKNHLLVPEIVEVEGMSVGRFEITRAQYNFFDTEREFPEGTGNYPVSGVSYEEALAYCRWLSKRTGRRFRLPREEEMKKLLAMARDNLARENNLEYWAGYEPTPEERKMLSGKIAQLEETRLLVEEVGSFKPVGKPAVYDLGGNVAEWVTSASGVGKVMGLSAVSSRDPRTPSHPPPARYVGFRVAEDR